MVETLLRNSKRLYRPMRMFKHRNTCILKDRYFLPLERNINNERCALHAKAHWTISWYCYFVLVQVMFGGLYFQRSAVPFCALPTVPLLHLTHLPHKNELSPVRSLIVNDWPRPVEPLQFQIRRLLLNLLLLPLLLPWLGCVWVCSGS